MPLTTPLTMSHRATAAATTLLRLGSKGFTPLMALIHKS